MSATALGVPVGVLPPRPGVARPWPAWVALLLRGALLGLVRVLRLLLWRLWLRLWLGGLLLLCLLWLWGLLVGLLWLWGLLVCLGWVLVLWLPLCLWVLWLWGCLLCLRLGLGLGHGLLLLVLGLWVLWGRVVGQVGVLGVLSIAWLVVGLLSHLTVVLCLYSAPGLLAVLLTLILGR